MENALGVGDANGEGANADSTNMLIVTGGLSFAMSFIRDSMSPMRLLSTKCDDALQSEVMVNFGGPGGPESARNA